MKPITVHIQFASIQGSVFPCNGRTVQSSVLLWLSDSNHSHIFGKKSSHSGKQNLFFLVFHQDLPPFTTSPTCHWRSECIYWVTLQDPVSCLFQCPTFIEFRMTRGSWKPSDPTALFCRRGLLEEIPSHLSTACSGKDEHLGVFAWISWWDHVLGIGVD